MPAAAATSTDAAAAAPNDSPRSNMSAGSRVFLPGRKQAPIKRYWALLFFFSALSATFVGVFTGYWSTSVAPVLALNADGAYIKEACTVTGRRLEHDVSVGIHSVWRGEVSVAYIHPDKNETFTAMIHDHITGVYGAREKARHFLLQHTVGSEISCYVEPSEPFYAASARPQVVYSSVIFICCVLGALGLASIAMMLVTLKGLVHFTRSMIWVESEGTWVEVTGSV
jgi:hypothetical protein